jgi:hypothetical protein
MGRYAALFSLMAVLPVAAHANTAINLASTSCSGALSISSLAGASLSCAGNLTLNGGWINSDTSIFIRSAGDLLLENLNLNAPEISISTISGNLQMASTVNIKAIQTEGNGGGQVAIYRFPGQPIIDWKPFDLRLNPGGNINFNMPGESTRVLERTVITNRGNIIITSGDIQITSGMLTNNPIAVSSVPEANTGGMLLLGLSLLALRRRPG